ncbi:hypothetical protein Pla52o_16670 [Novipirellula galeiformis]|uniref:Uncharacterized protein n=1 Tax=Novipirellula galeiformis TaxID=2528004 RepID=A0A5C6CQJ3_9BACT|nr:hypothetical protein Pla52o_16670 [Novipirellula galeiformis]
MIRRECSWADGRMGDVIPLATIPLATIPVATIPVATIPVGHDSYGHVYGGQSHAAKGEARLRRRCFFNPQMDTTSFLTLVTPATFVSSQSESPPRIPRFKDFGRRTDKGLHFYQPTTLSDEVADVTPLRLIRPAITKTYVWRVGTVDWRLGLGLSGSAFGVGNDRSTPSNAT